MFFLKLFPKVKNALLFDNVILSDELSVAHNGVLHDYQIPERILQEFSSKTPNRVNSMRNQIIKYFGMSSPNINLLSPCFCKTDFYIISIGN